MSSTWPPHNPIDCHARQGVSAWLPSRIPLAWKQLCGTMAFPFYFTGVPCVESLGSDTMALKSHESCACRISGTDPGHPPAAAHEQELQPYEAMPQCHCPPRSHSSYTSRPIPGCPEDSSSHGTRTLGFWAAAGSIGVVTPLAYAALSTAFHERH